MDDARFQSGDYDTSFLSPKWLADHVEAGADIDDALLAFVALMKEYNIDATSSTSAHPGAQTSTGSGWKRHLGWKQTRR